MCENFARIKKISNVAPDAYATEKARTEASKTMKTKKNLSSSFKVDLRYELQDS